MACVHRKNRSILVPFFRQEPPGTVGGAGSLPSPLPGRHFLCISHSPDCLPKL